MTQVQSPSIKSKGRTLMLVLLFLPIILGGLIFLWPDLSDAVRYPLQAVFFVVVSIPAIILLRERGRRREWFVIVLGAVLVAWNLYDAFKAWGLISP
ncbi:MAG TPA: hypothetical protein VJ790_11855 [Dongiaceae bacterium]|nr:hypothetical protein [Dongiaceae bacterium]